MAKWEDVFDKPTAPGPPPGPPPAPIGTGAKASWQDVFDKPAGAPIAAASAATAGGPAGRTADSGPGWHGFFNSVLGDQSTEEIGQAVRDAIGSFSSILPDSLTQSDEGQWVGKAVQATADRVGVEGLKFLTSPAGISLIAAHALPYTAPLAGLVDVGMGALAGVSAIPAASRFLKDRSPENFADLAANLIVAYGGIKGGTKTIAKNVAGRMAKEPAGFNQSVIEAAKAAPDLETKLSTLEAARPDTVSEKVKEFLSKKPILGNIPALIGNAKTFPKLMELSSEVVGDANALRRHIEIQSERTLQRLVREVPADQRDVQKMGYVLQGVATPEEVGLSPKAADWVEKLREHRKEVDRLQGIGYMEDIPGLDPETYLTQIWDFGENPAARRAGRTMLKDPFFKQRQIENYKEGIEERGLTPKYRDIADIVRVRDQFAARAAANNLVAKTFRQMGVVLSRGEYDKADLDGWVKERDAPALDRAVYVGQTAAGGSVFSKEPVFVHPDFHPAIKALFAQQDPSSGWMALDAIRSVTKKMRLSFSFFHHNALAEQAHATDIFRKPGRLLTDVAVFNPEFWRGMRSGLWDVANRPGAGPITRAIGRTLGDAELPPVVRASPDLVNPWVDARLQLQSGESEALVGSKLREWAASANMVKSFIGKALRPAVDASHVWDKALWDFYHQGLMLNSAETIYSGELNAALKAGRILGEAEKLQIRRATADHVNNAFGAINYQNLLQSPRAIRAMNLMVLAPAWTLSNIRVLSNAFENEAARRIGGKWAIGAAASWFLTTQLFNYAMTSYYNMPDKDGKTGGHFSWDNPGAPMRVAGQVIPGMTENSLNFAQGYDERGRERYVKLGRTYREPLLWLLAPLETFGSKAGMIPREAMVQLTGSVPGSGYQEIDSRRTKPEQFLQGLASLSDLITPIGLEELKQDRLHAAFPDLFPEPAGSGQFMSIPAGAGLSATRAIEAYTEALDHHQDDVAIEILNAAAKNNIPTGVVIHGYRDNLMKRRRTAEGPNIKYDTFGRQVPVR